MDLTISQRSEFRARLTKVAFARPSLVPAAGEEGLVAPLLSCSRPDAGGGGAATGFSASFSTAMGGGAWTLPEAACGVEVVDNGGRGKVDDDMK